MDSKCIYYRSRKVALLKSQSFPFLDNQSHQSQSLMVPEPCNENLMKKNESNEDILCRALEEKQN